jgi:hypothetical protein
LPLEERYFINQISASQRENLVAVYHALLQCPTGYINLPNTLSNPSENIDELSDLLYYSCPELVQLSTNKMSMSYTKKQVQFNVTMSLSEYENYCIELFDILYELNENTRDMTDWEKSKYVYDFIIQSTTYEAAASDSVNAHEGSALGPLIVGRARCQGYANAYQLCMWAVGVECYAVTGVAGPDNGRHAWNIANIDGNYYLSDVTWDDIDQASSGYAYFNVSSAEFPQHTADAFWINLNMPQCNKNDMSFFKINDAYIGATEDTKAEFLRIMDLYYPESNVIQLKFESAEQYTATVDTTVLSQYVSEWAIKHNIGFSYQIIKFSETNVLYLELIL